MKNNESYSEMKIKFYNSKEWQDLRYIVLREQKGTCQLCGRTRKDGIILHVDHIIPLSKDWSKRLDKNNLQVLCEDCNLGKSNTDSIDWRINKDLPVLKKNAELTLQKFSEMTFIQKLEKSTFFQSNKISRSAYLCSVMAKKLIVFAISLGTTTLKKILLNKQSIELPVWSARFSISDFIKKFEITDSGENYQVIRKAIEECQSVKITLEKGKGFKSYNWFYSVEFSPEKDFVEMTFSPDVGAAIYNLKNGYIAMRFSVIKDFKSLYSFRYYEIANSYIGNKGKNGNKKGCWFFEYDVQTLKQILGIKKNAYESRMNNFIAWVIKKPLDELNKINNDFKIEFKKILENRKTVGFRFECTELSKQLKIAKTDSPEEKQEKREINEDWAKEPLWARMQEKYPEVWAEYFDQEKHSGFFVFDEVAKNATYERMLSEGFEI